jgi:hypothetical protein
MCVIKPCLEEKAKMWKANVAFSCLSVCPPHGRTRLPLDGFSWNLILEYFSKYVEKIQFSLISNNNNRYFTWKTNILMGSYLAQYFLEWEIFQTKVVDKIKTHILSSIIFFRKSCRLWDNVEKYGIVGQATHDNIIRRMRTARWIPKATNTHSRTM